MKTKTRNAAASTATGSKNIYALLGIGAVGTLGYFGLKYITDKAKAKPAVPAAPTATPARAAASRPATSAWKEGSFPLREGMLNTNKVKWLQMALIRLGVLASGTDDGDFGPKTAAALRTAQINPDNGVSVNSYNGLLQKAGLPQYMVSLTGEYLSRVPAVSPDAGLTLSPDAGLTLSPATATALRQIMERAMARLRMMDKAGYFVTLSDALAFINTYMPDQSQYRAVDSEWRKQSGKTIFATFTGWTWSAANRVLVVQALQKAGGGGISGMTAADSILF